MAYEVVRTFGADVGNLRISDSAVELDLLLESEANLHTAVEALESKLGSLLTLRELDVPTPPIEEGEAIKLGLDLFNEQRYWESHEALQSAWRKASWPEKEVLQGIILLAAAFVHLQKNEHDIALSVMKRAHGKLIEHHDEYFGIDIASLDEKISGNISVDQPNFFKIETKR